MIIVISQKCIEIHVFDQTDLDTGYGGQVFESVSIKIKNKGKRLLLKLLPKRYFSRTLWNRRTVFV